MHCNLVSCAIAIHQTLHCSGSNSLAQAMEHSQGKSGFEIELIEARDFYSFKCQNISLTLSHQPKNIYLLFWSHFLYVIWRRDGLVEIKRCKASLFGGGLHLRERGLHHISLEFIRIHQREGIDAIVFCYISQMRKANTYCNMQIGFVLEL